MSLHDDITNAVNRHVADALDQHRPRKVINATGAAQPSYDATERPSEPDIYLDEHGNRWIDLRHHLNGGTTE